MKNASNVGLHVVHLQSANGFSAVVPGLVGRNPSGVVEFAVIIDDPELHPIRLMPADNPHSIRARERAIGALVASVSGATTLLLQLPGSPDFSLYIWAEFDSSKRDPSVAVSDKLSHLYGTSTNVRVLSQFPCDADGSASAQTIAVRAEKEHGRHHARARDPIFPNQCTRYRSGPQRPWKAWAERRALSTPRRLALMTTTCG